MSSSDPHPVQGDLTVIIPTLGRPVLEECLAAISAGTVRPARIVVADQGENPAVALWLRRLGDDGLPTTHVPCERRGPGAGRNRAIERVETQFFAATDDDCIAAPDWLERMAARLAARPEAIVTGRVEAPAGGTAPSTITDEESAVHRRPMLAGDPLYTGNMGVALAVARAVGPFDENPALAAAAEDNDWAYRALTGGVAIVYAPEARVTHMDWRDAAQMEAVYRAYARGQGAFYGKYLRRGDAFIAHRAGRDLLRGPVRWLRGRLRGDADRIASGRAWTRCLAPGIWAGLRHKGGR